MPGNKRPYQLGAEQGCDYVKIPQPIGFVLDPNFVVKGFFDRSTFLNRLCSFDGISACGRSLSVALDGICTTKSAGQRRRRATKSPGWIFFPLLFFDSPATFMNKNPKEQRKGNFKLQYENKLLEGGIECKRVHEFLISSQIRYWDAPLKSTNSLGLAYWRLHTAGFYGESDP